MDERVVRDAQPDPWTQGASGVDTSVPTASADEPAESIEVTFDATADAETPPLVRVSTLLSEPSVDSESTEGVALMPEAAAVQVAAVGTPGTAPLAGDDDEVLDMDSMLESPPPPEYSAAGDESEARTQRHPSSVNDDGIEPASGDAAQHEDAPLAAADADAAVALAAPGDGEFSSLLDQDAPTRVSNMPVVPPLGSAEVGEASDVSRRDDRAGSPVPVRVAAAATLEPQPAAVRVLPSDAPTTRDAEAAPRRSSGRGYVGLGLGMAALGVVFLGYSQFRSSHSPVEEATPAAAVDPAPAEPAEQALPSHADAPAPVGEPTQAAVNAPEVQAAPAEPSQPTTESAVAGVAQAKVAQRPEPSRTGPVSPKAAGSAADSETEAEDQAPAEPAVAKFDADAAASALESAAGRASSCRQASDPSGIASVTITFAPSGRVTTANISGPPFVGTATGSCIASTLRTAQIPPFSGGHVTVRKTVTIR